MTPNTVMDPAFGTNNPNDNLQEYCRNLSRWVDTVFVAAEQGSDPMYQTFFTTLAKQLYSRGLSAEQKSVVNEAQTEAQINYKQDDQFRAVREIVELVSVDPSIAFVSRLIASYNKVTNCQRRGSESLISFVSRFRGLAADHLLHLGVSASSQVSEILAITLLNNANLSDETLTNAKLAQALEEESPQCATSIKKETLEKLENISFKVQQFPLEAPLRLLKSDTHKRLKLKILASRRKVERFSDALEKAVQEIKSVPVELPSAGELLLRTAPRFRLNLDDDVTVIRNLSFNGQNGAKMYTRAEIDTIVGHKVQSAMLTLSKGQFHTSQGSESKRQGQSCRPSPQSQKRNSSSDSFCYDCGDPNHMSGSPECKTPSFLTKKRRSERSGIKRKKQTPDNQAT